MFLKLFAVDGTVFPEFKILDAATILGLKLRLGKMVNISAQNISIKYLKTTLEDAELLSKAALKCLALGVDPNSVESQKTDLIAYHENKLVGWLRVLKNRESQRSTMPRILFHSVRRAPSLTRWSTYSVIDSKIQEVCMDAECSIGDDSSQSSSGGSIGDSLDGSKCNAAASITGDDPEGETGCRERCCPFDPNRPVYTQVMPENRQYAVVIEKGSCEELNEERVLHYLTQHLKTADEAQKLFFSICAPVILLDDVLMLVGGDADTRDWLLRTTRPICPPYVVTEFIKFFNLKRWCFTIPLPFKRSLCRIFGIFEAQNCPLDTGEWVVMSQYIFDSCSAGFKERAVDENYPNMEVVVYIDSESAELISKNCHKIDFLVWKLPCRPCSSIC